MDANITLDTGAQAFGFGSGKLDWGQALQVDSGVGTMYITPQSQPVNSKRWYSRPNTRRMIGQPQSKPFFETGPVQFSIDSRSWDTTSSQCSVGGWENKDNDAGSGPLPNRQMDCKFDCSVSISSKRSIADSFEYGSRNDQDLRDMFSASSRTIVNPPSAVEDNMFNVRALSDRGKDWQRYAPSGTRYYKEWQRKLGDDAPYPCNFDDVLIFNEPTKLVLPARSIREVLTTEDLSIDRNYYAIAAKGPKDEPIADFQNTISPNDGVILANGINRGALPSHPNDPFFEPTFPDGRAPVPWHFSSVAWWMWKKTMLTANPLWVDDPSQADFSGLKTLFQRNIDNLSTVAILNEAFEGHGITDILEWTPDNSQEDVNPFWALLGSPNGNGAQHLATDNKVALRGKGIRKIKATSIDGWYTMWMTFG